MWHFYLTNACYITPLKYSCLPSTTVSSWMVVMTQPFTLSTTVSSWMAVMTQPFTLSTTYTMSSVAATTQFCHQPTLDISLLPLQYYDYSINTGQSTIRSLTLFACGPPAAWASLHSCAQESSHPSHGPFITSSYYHFGT